MKMQTTRRTGFTLIELLVVLGIISLLLALTAGAVFRYRQTSMEKDTAIEMRKINIGLDQQWKAARDRIMMETIPPAVVEATTSPNGLPDNARAKALHLRLRLRQEFPQTYDEARNGILVGPAPSPQTGVTYFYAPKDLYLIEIGLVGNDPRPGYEGAVLLMLALKQGRGGIQFNAESIGGVVTEDVAGRPQKFFVDAWGHPITLRRAAGDGETDVLTELSAPPFAPANGYKDLLDPEGRLLGNWIGKAQMSARMGESFTLNVNRGPYIQSAGKDGFFSTPDDMFGFRIQQSGKGN